MQKDGNLRKNLSDIIKSDWKRKLEILVEIIHGLDVIHQQKFVHCDFHNGNIFYPAYISNFGSCRPVEYFQSSKKYDVYGVLPFVAPEVLRGKPYTLASDIYSFSMIMWEFLSGVSPFNDREHDFQLALNICNGERPEIIVNIPQCYIYLMKKCWDEDPLKRPDAFEINGIIENWYNAIVGYDNIENFDGKLKSIIMEFQKAGKVLEQEQTSEDQSITKSNPQAYHKIRLIDFIKYLNDQEEIAS